MRPPLMQTAPLLTRINVTPIIDVALTLVIILLIAAPTIPTAKLDVVLPPANARDADDPRFVSITVSRAGEIAVDDQLVPGTGALATVLRARLDGRADADRYVVVRADAGVSHGVVREVLDAAKDGGATRLGVATRQKTGGGA